MSSAKAQHPRRRWNCEGLDLIAAGLLRDAVAVLMDATIAPLSGAVMDYMVAAFDLAAVCRYRDDSASSAIRGCHPVSRIVLTSAFEGDADTDMRRGLNGLIRPAPPTHHHPATPPRRSLMLSFLQRQRSRYIGREKLRRTSHGQV
jgi:hypothetical protein